MRPGQGSGNYHRGRRPTSMVTITLLVGWGWWPSFGAEVDERDSGLGRAWQPDGEQRSVFELPG
jgi:hypothetical protein